MFSPLFIVFDGPEVRHILGLHGFEKVLPPHFFQSQQTTLLLEIRHNLQSVTFVVSIFETIKNNKTFGLYRLVLLLELIAHVDQKR